jgi:hypothetical protein
MTRKEELKNQLNRMIESKANIPSMIFILDGISSQVEYGDGNKLVVPQSEADELADKYPEVTRRITFVDFSNQK